MRVAHDQPKSSAQTWMGCTVNKHYTKSSSTEDYYEDEENYDEEYDDTYPDVSSAITIHQSIITSSITIILVLKYFVKFCNS